MFMNPLKIIVAVPQSNRKRIFKTEKLSRGGRDEGRRNRERRRLASSSSGYQRPKLLEALTTTSTKEKK